MANGSDLARRRFPCIGTGVLHFWCKRDLRVLNGNCEIARDNLRHMGDYHIPVSWSALVTTYLRRENTHISFKWDHV